MSDPINQPAGAQSVGSNLLISYEELVRIRTYMASIEAKLDATLALKGQVDALDKRVAALERKKAFDSGEKKSWNVMVAFMGGMASTALVEVGLRYLPKLWGA
jgi:hypothetical protein